MAHQQITTLAELRELYGEPGIRSVQKEYAYLHPHHRTWIAESPFLVLATAGDDGTCDASPKGDPKGFVHVVDERTIALPDRPGNSRVDSFQNVLVNPRVGLLFLVPGRDETLRVNGRARLLRDAPYFDELVVKGHRPRVAMHVDIDQVFFHCAKAFKRSGLWRPDSWGDPDRLPTMACIVKDTMRIPETLAEMEAYYGAEYEKRLYA